VLTSSSLIAFVATADLHRARRFYEDVLALELVEQSDFACVFDAAGTMLRVTLADPVVAAGYTVLGWSVDDIGRCVEALTANGVTFTRYDGMDQDAAGIWRTPGGDQVAWFADPDGNTLSLTQFGTRQ
jgi:catechol 2,3-dioxygenase-like lactoylglutathione lyase family enzyme